MEEVGRAEAPSGPCPTNVPLTTKTSNKFSPGSNDIPVFKKFQKFQNRWRTHWANVVVSYKQERKRKYVSIHCLGLFESCDYREDIKRRMNE